MVLESYGFMEAGEWHLSKRHRSEIEASLSRLTNERVVYAFIIDNEVKYVGICDSPNTLLKDRMSSHRFNKNMPDLIRTALKQNRAVKIFALKPEEVEYRGLKVDMVRGLEYPVIRRLEIPEWNRILSNYRRQNRQDVR